MVEKASVNGVENDSTDIIHEESSTSYQQLIKQNHRAERTDFRWDTVGDELL